MEEVIKFLDQFFYPSVLNSLQQYLQANAIHDKWFMFSDYCIGDKTKRNDVVSFTIMPYDDYPENIQNKISLLSSTDIKHKRNINPDFCAYLKEKRLFHVIFFLGTRKGLTQYGTHTTKDFISQLLSNTTSMLDKWCENTPSNLDYFNSIKRKIEIIRKELSKKSPNYTLFRNVLIVSL